MPSFRSSSCSVLRFVPMVPMAPTVAVAAVALVLGIAGALAATPVRAAVNLDAGIYTEAQAEAGEALYEAHCQTCHETDYYENVFRAWSGQPLPAFYNVMAATMPQSNPGSLYDEQYVEILAYILAENDFPAGDSPLPMPWAGMDAITVSAP